MRGPKLVIQIPCYNEEDSLPVTLAAVPDRIAGMGQVEVLVINDGSQDRTVEVARKHGVEHILDLGGHVGLAKAFLAGLREALRLGADYVVNLDADNQYCADDIPKLLRPLMEGTADIVVGERPIDEIDSFSPLKKRLQIIGSWVVRRLSGTDVRDSPSGFRAFNRRAMMRLFIFNDYTYTHESLIAAGDSGLRVVGVPIRVNPTVLRPSRLMTGLASYLAKSANTILRFYLLYNPRQLLNTLALAMGIGALALMVRFLVYYFLGEGQGHIQSLILASILATGGMLNFMLAVISDIVHINRKLLQAVLGELWEQRYGADGARVGKEGGGGERQ